MRKILLFSLIYSIFAATAFAANFAPLTLKLSAPSVISYKFDGSNVAVPVTVTGTPADVSFMVFTKDQGSKISKITNGFLGWHYVNKIDTCLYLAPTNQLGVGVNTINWNGKDKAGTLIPSGTYTFYMFGYDNKSERTKVSQFISPAAWSHPTILENDKSGKPLANPVLYMSDQNRGSATTAFAHTNKKWIIGNNPEDATLLETCKDMCWADAGNLAFLPTDQTKYFHDTLKGAGTKFTRKFTWVPNGDAVLNTDWGDNGEYTYTGAWPAGWSFGPGAVSDGKDWLLLVNADLSGAGKESQLIAIDAMDGSFIKKIDISKWWVDLTQGDPNVGGQNCGGPSNISFRNGLIALDSHSSCVNSLMNPYATTTDDAVLWINRNGDIIGDHNWETTTKKPWVCNDYNVGPYKYNNNMDNQGFVIFVALGMGAVSFGLYAPDGTGIAYKAHAAETSSGQKTTFVFVDYSSLYDGIYTNFSAADDKNVRIIVPGLYYLAHDSFKGVITSSPVKVEEAAPAAFAVAQNTPNPFNPSTSICFTLAKAGLVTVDIYNAAGQKVDTVMNTTMNAGNHSATWNASKFSAGVYFYTVKSGDFSKTMKMTLLK